MKLIIDDDKCIGCGSCVSLTDSKVFDFNDDGKAYVKNENIEDEMENVETAIDYCPTGAITKEETD